MHATKCNAGHNRAEKRELKKEKRKSSLWCLGWGIPTGDKRWFAQVLPAEGDGGGVYSLTNVWTSHLCVW